MQQLFCMMYGYYCGDPHQIQHFVKVHSFARQIGMAEKLGTGELEILEIAAIVHDIGIKKALEKHGSSSGKYQELEGPSEARALLARLRYPETVIERVCYLVGRHHTYTGVDGMDYQILLEADFIVNMHESTMTMHSIRSVMKKIFRTKTGKQICGLIFDV